MNKLSEISRGYIDLAPSRRAFLLYGLVFVVITCSRYSFLRFRIPLFELGSILPDTGVFLCYLWIILFLDEFLVLFGKSGLFSRFVKTVKRASLYVIAVYALVALLLAINGISIQQVSIVPARIVAKSKHKYWASSYGSILVEEQGATRVRREILLFFPSETQLFVGEDVEIVMRKGIFFCNRVLAVRRDMEKYYGKMLKAAPDSLVALKGLVLVCSEQGRFDEAKKWYSLYAGKNSDEDGIGTTLSRRMIDAGQYAQSAQFLEELIRKDRGYENLYTLGYALAWAGDKDGAAAYLHEAVKLDPTDYRALYSLGYVYMDTGQLTAAKKAWEAVLALTPHFPEVEKNLRKIDRELAVQQKI